MPEDPGRLDTLRRHLLEMHRNQAAGGLTLAEATEQHYDEHNGPGGLRNHGEPAELHDWLGMALAFVRDHAEDGDADERYNALERRVANLEWSAHQQVEWGVRLTHMLAAVGQLFEAVKVLHEETFKMKRKE